MDVPDDKRRSVEPYLKFLRRLDEDVPLDTRVFHILYEFTAEDFERLRSTLGDVDGVGFSVPAIDLESREGVARSLSRLVADGHELVLHGYRHTSFMDTQYDIAHGELSRAFDIVESTTGESPSGLHVPFMAASEGTLRAAADLGIEWVVGRRRSGGCTATNATPETDLHLMQPVRPYDLQLLERGLSPTATFERLDEQTDESSLMLCHPNIHLHHDATDAFAHVLHTRSYRSPGDLAGRRGDGPALLLDCFPPFRVS